MKKLIIGMIATLTAITGYSATDAELKAMLEAKDYAKFVYAANTTQLSNLATSVDAPYICEAVSMTNQIWKSIVLCNAKLIDWKTATDIAIEKQNPDAFKIAVYSEDNELILNVWEKVLDIPNVSINSLQALIYNNKICQIKINNLALAQKTAEIILNRNNKYYTAFVYSYAMKASDEYKAWAESCVKNVNEKTCELSGWNYLMYFNPSLLKSNMYYFESNWKTSHPPKAIHIYNRLKKTAYYTIAVNTVASSVTDPESAFFFANNIDKLNKNKEMTNRLYPVISKDIHLACKVAFELNDIDKVIDIMLNAGEELTVDELSKMIPMINALDVDHRSAEVVKALRNINSRYTLRLYNEREVWEPILSKIRAMIDVRQM